MQLVAHLWAKGTNWGERETKEGVDGLEVKGLVHMMPWVQLVNHGLECTLWAHPLLCTSIWIEQAIIHIAGPRNNPRCIMRKNVTIATYVRAHKAWRQCGGHRWLQKRRKIFTLTSYDSNSQFVNGWKDSLIWSTNKIVCGVRSAQAKATYYYHNLIIILNTNSPHLLYVPTMPILG